MDQASRSGKSRKRRWTDGPLFARQALSVAAAVMVAVATLLPGDTSRQMSVLVDKRQVGDDLNAVLPFLIVGLTSLAVIGVVWKSGLAKRMRMSWPLFAVAIVYLFALAVLVSAAVRGAVFGLVSSSMSLWLRRTTGQLDAEHLVTYIGFTVLVALAWRQKVAWWWLALGVFGYGWGLELLQQLVPGRSFEWNDVVSNGLGVLFGLIGLGLFDLLAEARKGPSVQVPEERRRRRSGRSSRSGARSLRAAARSGLITALAGLSIAVASLLVGSMAELRLVDVGRQILTPFSATYAFTFWLGVLVMGVGGLMLRGIIRSRGRRVRTASPR